MVKTKFTRLSIEGPVKSSYTGLELLNIPSLNKGSAFTQKEREHLDLIGLLPPHISSLEEQVSRAYRQYQSHTTDIAKNIFLTSLKDRNEVLYYRLVLTHIKEMLRIVSYLFHQALNRIEL